MAGKILFRLSILYAVLLFQSGCVLAPMQCMLTFGNYNKTFEFDCSKEVLKDRIVESYSYDESVFLKVFGKTVIENEALSPHHYDPDVVFINKGNWDEFKTSIRKNTPDTLHISIGKHFSRKGIDLVAIVSGNDRKSSLIIKGFNFRQRRACEKDPDYYQGKIEAKIIKTFIHKI